MEKIIECTICNNGSIVDLGNNYVCDNIKSIEDKCEFNVFKNFMGVEITHDIIKELFTDGITRQFKFTKNDETTFTAALKLNKEKVNGKLVSLEFENHKLTNRCPKCGKSINITPKGYSCNGYREGTCDFYINKEIAGVEIPLQDIEYLLDKNETKEFYEFNGRKKNFLAKLIIDKEFNTTFKSEICKCPKCGDGQIIGAGKVYMCNSKECGFYAFRNYRFKDISVDEIKKLFSGEIVTIRKVKKKDKSGTYDANLKLLEDFTIISV